MTTITAGVFAGRGVLEIQDRPVPHLTEPDQVLLEVEAARRGEAMKVMITP